MADLLARLRDRPVRWRDPAPRTDAALRAFKWNLASANSHPLAAFLSFEGEEAFGIGPDWRGMVSDLEAEGSALIGAVPCPDGVPHGWERMTTEPVGAVEGFGPVPCPSCGAAV